MVDPRFFKRKITEMRSVDPSPSSTGRGTGGPTGVTKSTGRGTGGPTGVTKAPPKKEPEVKASYVGKDEEKKVIGETKPVTNKEKKTDEQKAGEQAGFTQKRKNINRIKSTQYKRYKEYQEFQAERSRIESRLTGEQGTGGRVLEGTRFISGVFIRPSVLPSIANEAIFGEKEGKRERVLNIYTENILGLSKTAKQGLYGNPAGLFAESYKPGGYGFITTSAAITGGAVGSTKAVFPFVGKTAEAGIIGYGGYKITEPGLSGNWQQVGKNVVSAGIYAPTVAISYGMGAASGASIIKSSGIKPIEYGANFYSKINPMRFIKNKWVKSKAEYVPPENYIDPKVFKGKKTFPESSPSQTYKDFLKGYDKQHGGYKVVHATAGKFKTGEIVLRTPKRSTDVYGLYVTPSRRASSYFLRTDSGGYSYSSVPNVEFSLLPKAYKPSFREFVVKTISKGPRSVRTNISRFRSWQLRNTGKSQVTLTPAHQMKIKLEAEGVISPSAKYTPTSLKGLLQKFKGYKRYTTIEGKNIPIYEYKVGSFPGKNVAKTVFKQAESSSKYYSSSYGTTQYYSLYSPFSFSLASYLTSSKTKSYGPKKYYSRKNIYSYAPSIVRSTGKSRTKSYKPSRKVSYAPSYTPSYKAPSYKSSYTNSYKKSYATSKINSYAPSYTPSSYKMPFYSKKKSYYSDKFTVKNKKTKFAVEKLDFRYRFRKFNIKNPLKESFKL